MSWAGNVRIDPSLTTIEEIELALTAQVREMQRHELQKSEVALCGPEMMDATNVLTGAAIAIIESGVAGDYTDPKYGFYVTLYGHNSIDNVMLNGTREPIVCVSVTSTTLNAGSVEESPTVASLPRSGAETLGIVPAGGFMVGPSAGATPDFIRKDI
jgi:hypothetical protein